MRSLQYIVFFLILFILSQEIYCFDNNKISNFITKTLQPSELAILNNADDNSAYQFIYTLLLPKIIVNVNSTRDINKLPKNCTFIIIESYYEDLNGTLTTFARKKWNIRNNYLLLFEKITVEEMQLYFQLLWQYNIYKVAIYLKNIFYTHYPYKIENNCGENIVLVKTSSPLLWKVPTKWHKCTVRIAASKTSHVIKNQFNTTDPGTFILFTNIMGKAMDVNIHYIKLNEDYVAIYKRNLSWNVLRTIMRNQNVNLGYYFGMLDTEERDDEEFESTYHLLHFKMFLIVPKLALSYHPSVIYSNAFIFAFALFAMLVTIIWKLSTKLALTNSILHFVQLLLQNNINAVPKTTSAKFLFAITLAFCMLNNCIYQTLLSSNLTTMKIRKINSVQELMQTSIPIFSKKLFFTFPPLNKIDKQHRKIETLPYIELSLRQLRKTQDYAITISNEHLSYIKNPSSLVLLQEDVLVESSHRFLVPHGYPLLETLNFWLITLQETGIMQKCLFESEKYLQQISFDVPHIETTKLTLENLFSTFCILIGGVILSTIVFAIEIISSHCKRS